MAGSTEPGSARRSRGGAPGKRSPGARRRGRRRKTTDRAEPEQPTPRWVTYPERIARVKRRLKKTERELSRLGMARDGEPHEITLRREALRRRRIKHQLDIEALRRAENGGGAGRARPQHVPGSRWGVRTVVNGGLPGLGKRR